MKNAAAKKKAAPKTKATGKKKTTPLEKQPQSKQQAATQAGIFLHTDGQWSLAYFNPDDLHSQERELFG